MGAWIRTEARRRLRIGIIAALPRELKPLVRGWERLPSVRGSGIRMWQTVQANKELVAVCGGMGAGAARRAFVAAEFLGAMEAVLSVGWAGALSSECGAGKCYEAGLVIDAQTGERFATTGQGSTLVTTARVADEVEKQRLKASYGAAMVDMEAAAIARLAQMRSIPVRVFKGISDDFGMMLPDINPLVNGSGQLETVRFLAHVAVRRRYWASLVGLARNSSAAAKSLAARVDQCVKEDF